MRRIHFIYTSLLFIGIMFSCERANNFYAEFSPSDVTFDGNMYEYISHKPGEYDSLVLLLEILPELKLKLSSSNIAVSYFAVNNRSFALAIENLNTARKKNKLEPMYLEDFDKRLLDTLAHRYLFDEVISINDEKLKLDGITIPSSKYDYRMHWRHEVLTASGLVDAGEQQIIFSDINNSIYTRYWQNANTKSVNLRTDNGIMHTLSSQHEFAFGKLTNYYTKDKK